MAQTIAAQRGSTTNTGDGVTTTTLFTQSTGIATRVILNSVSMKLASATYVRMALLINVNGTGNLAAVAVKSTSSSSFSSTGIVMMPNSSPTVRSAPTGQLVGYFPDGYIAAGISGNDYLFSNIQNTRYRFFGASGTTNTYENGVLDVVPQQFWMNNGDSLVVICHNASTNSCDVLYSFTTITES